MENAILQPRWRTLLWFRLLRLGFFDANTDASHPSIKAFMPPMLLVAADFFPQLKN